MNTPKSGAGIKNTTAEITAGVDASANVPQFTLYTYTGSLAADARFTPPNNTIILNAMLTEGHGKLWVSWLHTGYECFLALPDLNPNSTGIRGPIMCAEGDINFTNSDVSGRALKLLGVTMV